MELFNDQVIKFIHFYFLLLKTKYLIIKKTTQNLFADNVDTFSILLAKLNEESRFNDVVDVFESYFKKLLNNKLEGKISTKQIEYYTKSILL